MERRHAAPPPHRRGRFLTDVIVELGSATRPRSRRRSTPPAPPAARPSRSCSRHGALSRRPPRARARRASRPRPSSTSPPSRSTWRRPSLIDYAAASATTRSRSASPRRAHAARRDGRPGERGRDRRHRDDHRHGDPAGGRQPGGSPRFVGRLGRMDDVVPEVVDGAEHESARPRSSICASRPTTRRSSSSSNPIIAQAVEQGASDIHFEPGWTRLRVRFRIDGVLNEARDVPSRDGRRRRARASRSWPSWTSPSSASRRTAASSLTIDGRHVDLRVVTLPSVHGESVVMRILDKSSRCSHRPRPPRHAGGRAPPLRASVLTSPTAPSWSRARPAPASRPRSTRRSALNTPEKNIVTIEDPVEYQLEGITQVQVNPRAGLTLRHRPALDDARRPRHHHGRRDPRPRDGADRRRGRADRPPRPLDAAHERRRRPPSPACRDGHRAVPRRLLDRLRRRAAARAHALPAPASSARSSPSPSLRDNGFPSSLDVEAYEPVGCARCNGTGYKGRLGLYEVMAMTEEIRRLARARARRRDRRCRGARRHAPACATTASRRSRPGSPRSPRSRGSRGPPDRKPVVSTQTRNHRKLAKISRAATIASMQTSKTVTAGRLAEDLQRFFHRAMKGDQGELLALVAARPDDAADPRPVRARQLRSHARAHRAGAQIGLSVAAAGRAVDGMVRGGFISRTEDPVDRRIKRLALADDGRAALARLDRGAPPRAAALRRHTRRRRAGRPRRRAGGGLRPMGLRAGEGAR